MREVQQQEFAEVTSDLLREKYPDLSNEDINFLVGGDKMLVSNSSIGIHKYNSLKNQEYLNNLHNEKYPNAKRKTLTDLEKKQIMLYEIDKVILDKDAEKRQVEYLKGVRGDNPKTYDTVPGVPLDKKTLYFGFLQVFEKETGEKFELNSDNMKNLEAVIKYFANDPDFFTCERLVKELDGKKLNNNFNKGILLVGSYGNGKSTVMKCLEILINHNFNIALEQKWDNILDWKQARFKVAESHGVVSEFEAINQQINPTGKLDFLKKYCTFRYCFQDMKKEKIASNFGITNLFQVVFEKRYDRKIPIDKSKPDGEKRIEKTHGTMNYHEDHPNDVSKAIDEIGFKYGGHIYDRFLEMFNFIEFKGKSFRK